ncbi:MAG: 1-acyl-sn-glycerol-3-phosphate acyltransferase [Proteobacteria bacterium]|jgi:1-acyl-sn-glycerol-3-phosphate acyltransferase|nr:1-acyl-sn-glycerol-3-phosphate acyltransferase [Pseudomonadota bacterium]
MMKQVLRGLGLIWVAISAPLVFLLLVLPVSIIAAPFSLVPRVRLVRKSWQAFGYFTIKYATFATMHIEDKRPPELKRYPFRGLYIANHQSYMDIPLILSQYQVPPIMKKEVLYLPVLGFLAWVAGALVVSRGKRDSRKKVFVKARERLVTHNYGLQYYPEGTRSRDGKPKDFADLKVTLLHLAFEENIPVIPVSMYGTSHILKHGEFIHFGKKVGIITHEPLEPKNYASANEFARAAWDVVKSGYSELASKLQN